MTPYVTGPAHIYCSAGAGIQQNALSGLNVPSGGTPLYLGTCIEAPKVRFTPKWSPLMNDLAGDQEPYDESYQGQSADIFGDLTVWNWSVLHLMKARPDSSAFEGVDPALAIGTLMITEGFCYTVWIDYPYYRQKAAFASAATKTESPAGYRFRAAWLYGPDEENPGTKPNSIHIQIKARRFYQPDGSFFLYDHNMTGIPNVPPTGVLGI